MVFLVKLCLFRKKRKQISAFFLRGCSGSCEGQCVGQCHLSPVCSLFDFDWEAWVKKSGISKIGSHKCIALPYSVHDLWLCQRSKRFFFFFSFTTTKKYKKKYPAPSSLYTNIYIYIYEYTEFVWKATAEAIKHVCVYVICTSQIYIFMIVYINDEKRCALEKGDGSNIFNV